MQRIAVLITGAGTTTALSVIKGLRMQSDLPIRIVAVDMNPECAGRVFSDTFYRVPAANHPDFIDSLLEICAREQVTFLVPIVDYEFLPLATAADRFALLGCKVSISSELTIRTCNEKDRTHAFFALHDIPKPRFYETDAIMRGMYDEGCFPLIIKPRLDGRGSIGVHKLDSQHDLDYWLRSVPDPLFEEYIDGREYTIDTLSDFDGRVIAVVPRERQEVKAGICYKGRTVNSPSLISWGARIASLLDIRGPSNIQCRVTQNGDIKFFEVNPRFAATVSMTIAAGVNMPALLARIACGAYIDGILGDFREVTMLRYWDEVFLQADGNPMPTSEDSYANAGVKT